MKQLLKIQLKRPQDIVLSKGHLQQNQGPRKEKAQIKPDMVEGPAVSDDRQQLKPRLGEDLFPL